ncbi:cytosine permease [Prauserella aidingensis]|uniref:cytosine permease n=1 Tax=Prauserella aidingensis TaxID=387890 RepID=UPI0020A3390C|nr:cytosine permease [Prauserella aidingensis]MCP2251387.1 cytosine permease [Prauserella aidingensis]
MTTSQTPPEPGAADPAPATATPVDRDHPLGRVPAHARKGVASLAVVIAGFGFFTPTMATGGQVAGAFPFSTFVVLALVSALVLACYIATLGLAAARTGLTTVLLARLALGRIGGKWASMLLGGTQVGWYGITVGVLATLLGGAFGLSVTWPLVLVGGIAMAVTAYTGFRGIELLSWLSVPLMTALCLWIAVSAVDEAGGWDAVLAYEGTGAMSAGAALTMMIGTFVSGGSQIGNWTRFAPGSTLAFAMTAATMLLVQFGLLAFGGLGAIGYGEPDFANVLLGLGSTGLAVLLIIANLWTTNDNTAYAFGVAGAELFGKPDKRPFIVGGVAVGIVMALTGIDEAITSFLTLLGVFVPPLGGVLIGTFLFSWKRRDPGTAVDDVPLVVWPGVLAYLGGTLVALGGSLLDVGIPAVQGIVVALALAAVLTTVATARRSTPG